MTTVKQPRKAITRASVRTLVAKVPKDRRAAMVCAVVGHSRIVEGCFGYVYCGRCGAQIADRLAGSGYASAPVSVQIGHNCPTCHANYKKLDWRDKYLAPNPFPKKVKHG